jgi:hypothetical protein
MEDCGVRLTSSFADRSLTQLAVMVLHIYIIPINEDECVLGKAPCSPFGVDRGFRGAYYLYR